MPNGIVGNYGANVFTISGAPTVSGTFNYTLTSTGGCNPDASSIGSIKVDPKPIAFVGADIFLWDTVNIPSGTLDVCMTALYDTIRISGASATNGSPIWKRPTRTTNCVTQDPWCDYCFKPKGNYYQCDTN